MRFGCTIKTFCKPAVVAKCTPVCALRHMTSQGSYTIALLRSIIEWINTEKAHMVINKQYSLFH